MKRFLIVFLTIVGSSAIFIISSGFDKDNSKKQIVYEHYQFLGSTYSELYFENEYNWLALGNTNPSINPCSTGARETCVLRIDQSLLSTDLSLSLAERLALYLQSLPGVLGSTNYVNSNYTYRKL